MLALNAVIQSNSLEISERPRWDLNPRITDLQSVPLGHLGTRPRPYPCTERLWRQRNEHFNLQIFWNHFRSGDFFASPVAPRASTSRKARHCAATTGANFHAASGFASDDAWCCANRGATKRGNSRDRDSSKHVENYATSAVVARRRVPHSSPWIS